MIGFEKRYNMRATKFKLKKIIRNTKIRNFYKNKTKEFHFSKEQQEKLKKKLLLKLLKKIKK